MIRVLDIHITGKARMTFMEIDYMKQETKTTVKETAPEPKAKKERRAINYIRVNGIIPCVASSPKGFFVASNEIEISECIGTLESLADAIQEVIEALRGQMYNKFGFRL